MIDFYVKKTSLLPHFEYGNSTLEMDGEKDGSKNKKNAHQHARIIWKKCARCGKRMKSEQLETKANEVCEECKTKLINGTYKGI